LNKRLIAPSILSADFSELGLEIERVTAAGGHLIHVDVMDGNFVPNLTLGMPIVKSIKPKAKLPLDVHLMIEKPERYIEEFIKAGSDYLTLHVESTTEMEVCLLKIRNQKIKSTPTHPGITLRPGTDIEKIKPYLHLVDLVLVMSVEPGFGGQSFRSDQLEKVRTLVQWRNEGLGKFQIEIDGGVNAETAPLCWDAGCDILVAGSAVFSGVKTSENYSLNIKKLLV